VLNLGQLASRRFGLLEVGAICIVVAALAGTLGRAPSRQPPLELLTAQQLGEHGAEEWMNLQRRYGTRYSRNAEEWIVRDYFEDRREGVFVDVGANDPRVENNTYFLETTLGWRGIAIDAVPDFAPEYTRLRPRTRFFSFFVSDVSDAVEDFYIPTEGPLGASDNNEVAERGGGPIDVRKVRTMTLNDLLAHERVERIDFLSMDIELAEPRALAGFDVERYRPGLVCIEAHPQVRQAILDYFHQHHYVLVGRYVGVDPQNLYFMPVVPPAGDDGLSGLGGSRGGRRSPVE
jgi:FkbM family methyltransferase